MSEQSHKDMMLRWAHLKDALRSSVSPRWMGFISQAQPQAHMGTVLLIAVPSEYARDVIQQKINQEFKVALENAFGEGTTEAIVIDTSLEETPDLTFTQPKVSQQTVSSPTANTANIVQESNSVQNFTSVPNVQEIETEGRLASPSFTQNKSPIQKESAPASDVEQPQPKQNTETSTASSVWESSARLNDKYTFDTFVIGQSNRFAHAAAFAVSETPASAYNPLFIYGDSGLGKTHLLHAIGHYAKRLYPELRVRYVNSEEFTNEFINSIRDDEGSSFKQIYRNVDMLLIDDIQFLAGKEHTQEEFFHTFNTLHNHQKQVVITSDLPPKMLTGFVERMRSRFEWGLITDVQPPELETRIAILRKKAQNESIEVPDDVMEYIASNITTNIRELEGSLIRVAAFASLNKQPIDLAVAERVLKDFITSDGAQEITASQILVATASYFDVSIEDLQSKSRTRTLVTARQIAMYLLRELTDMSLPKIGQELGGRDHTTVIHADRKIRTLMAERHQIFNQVNELTNKIKQAQRSQK